MDSYGIAGAVTAMAQERTMYAVSITMLKKTLDMQGDTALTLIAGVTQAPVAQNLPAHLGNNIDVTA
ncbi:YjfB family protein [Oxalicibacterium faecigallinarum]|uniref:Motility protein n=1 Tax=Oxalicibacterium faecigallinarum TaxID=573741 RepID=A0A8J3AR44_9BURK|nr:YjfB family protein [Oxalicibacterium faecigallinarum]GGI17280.1 hypothetical protein GCM10008066_08190 [Oxalicibacterium faecigallinarum]